MSICRRPGYRGRHVISWDDTRDWELLSQNDLGFSTKDTRTFKKFQNVESIHPFKPVTRQLWI